MAENAQITRLIQAKLPGGLTGTIEKVGALVQKRQNAPLVHVPGDGRSKAKYVNDPVVTIEALRLEFNPERDQAFCDQARALFRQHVLDPTIAGPVLLLSYGDDNGVKASVRAMRAVIQEVHLPEGDTANFALANAVIVVQPEDVAA